MVYIMGALRFYITRSCKTTFLNSFVSHYYTVVLFCLFNSKKCKKHGIYASRLRFHVLYPFCVCTSLCKSTQISRFVPFLRMYLSMQVDTDFTFCTLSAYVPLYASRHRFHVLYSFSVCTSLCKSTHVLYPFCVCTSLCKSTHVLYSFSVCTSLCKSTHVLYSFCVCTSLCKSTHVLYPFCVCTSLCKSTQISCFVLFLRMYLSMQVDTDFMFCTLSAHVPFYASRHRFHVLYSFCVCTFLCKSTQISCFVLFLRMYLSMQVDTDFMFCTLSAYVPLYASRHRFHVLYSFSVCTSLCKSTHVLYPFCVCTSLCKSTHVLYSFSVCTSLCKSTHVLYSFCVCTSLCKSTHVLYSFSVCTSLCKSTHVLYSFSVCTSLCKSTHVLYSFSVCTSLCKSTQISCFVLFLRMYLSMQVDTDFMFCTLSAYVPLYASRHRFHVLYSFCVCTSLCKSTQISCFVPFLRMYLSMQVDSDFMFCTLSAYVPLYASRHRFHVLYPFCVCTFLTQSPFLLSCSNALEREHARIQRGDRGSGPS